jgi:RimK family alpha-L-glutamate ligase
MLTYMALSGHGVSMPDSTPGPLFYDPSMPTDRGSCEVLENRYGYPMVVKECFGSSGKGVHLARDRMGLMSILDSLRGRPYLVQRCINTSVGEDLRIIVIGGKAIGSMLRHSDTDFRSNVALGGSSFNQDVSDVSRSVAEKVADVLDLDYCGVDLLKDADGEYSIVCEVNSNAFFESFEESTGINVAGAYARHIMDSMQCDAASEEIIE